MSLLEQMASAAAIVNDGRAGREWTGQVHRGCGGEVVLVIRPADKLLAGCCKACRKLWYMGTVESWTAEWADPLPEKAPEPLILLGRM
jgi:hypothetical protein